MDILSEEQQYAIELCLTRYKNNEPITVINGAAGTGKSYVLSCIINKMQLSPEEYVYCSYTGQAVRMLRQKGCHPAMTIHHMIYEMRPKLDGTFIKIKRRSLPYKIIFVDEISMISNDLLNDILRYKIPIIATGDNAQLGPIKKNEDNHLLDNPHATLTKIFRQKEGSGILDLATYIRTGGNLDKINEFQDTADVRIISKNDLSIGMLTWADQVICSTNKTRDSLNSQIRRCLNDGNIGAPQENDKIVITRNYWDTCSNESVIENEPEPLTNGMTGHIFNIRTEEIMMPIYPEQRKFKYLIADFKDELGNIWKDLQFDYDMFNTGNPSLSWKENMQIYKKAQQLLPIEALYGNVISVHKSQGAQFPKVILIEENWPYIEKDKRASLYTGITRASEKLIVITK